MQDLKQRGLLDSTIVVWGGEFGRTPMNEARGRLHVLLGRDHHPHSFSHLDGRQRGETRGSSFGETDELGYFVTQDKITVRDLQATIVHLMGFDPYKFSFKYQGLNQRLIGPTNEDLVVRMRQF